MKRAIIIFALIVFLAPSMADAAGTVTATRSGKQIIIDWTATAGGAATADIASTLGAYSPITSPGKDKIVGKVRSIQTIPGASGDRATNTPDAGYGVHVQDPYGYDISAGNLVSRSATAAELYQFTTPFPVDCELSLVIGTAGGAKQGRVILNIEPDK